MKECAAEIADSHCSLLNRFFTSCQVPLAWKINIVPIHKKGKKKLNWKLPICLARFYGVQSPRKAVDFWQSNDLFNPIQYMFLKGRSTVIQLLSCFSDWMESRNRSRSTAVIFLNFSQVYDSVPLDRLLLKFVSWNRWALTVLVPKLLNQSSATSRSAWSSLMWHEVTLKERFWILSFFLSTSTTYRPTFPLKSNVRRRHQIHKELGNEERDTQALQADIDHLFSPKIYFYWKKSKEEPIVLRSAKNAVRHHTERN